MTPFGWQLVGGVVAGALLGSLFGKHGLRFWLYSPGTFLGFIMGVFLLMNPWFNPAAPVDENVRNTPLITWILTFGAFVASRCREYWRSGPRTFQMSTKRHHDADNGFSIGLPKGWTIDRLTEDDIDSEWVFSMGTRDKQTKVSIACGRNLVNFSQWRKKRLDDFEDHRDRFAAPSPMRAPSSAHLPYPPLDGASEVEYRRFTAERNGFPKLCLERFVFQHDGFGYVIDHFVTGSSHAEIGPILGTWRFEPRVGDGQLGVRTG